MVITITMKNVTLRSGTYHFRIKVPKDCQDSVGKTEITQSLKTKEASEADRLAKGLTDDWKKKFEEIRNPASSPALAIQSKTNETVDDFKKTLFAYMDKNLSAFLDKKSEEELYELSGLCQEQMSSVGKNEMGSLDFSETLGIQWPLSKQYSPGMTRKLNRVIVDALGQIRSAIDDESGDDISRQIDDDLMDADARMFATQERTTSSPTSPDEMDIGEVAKLMLDAKNTEHKYREFIEAEAKYLQEWLKGKAEITTFTKRDLVDYARNCLPYFPKDFLRKPAYKNKSLHQCVKLTNKNPDKYVPISYRTAQNRMAALQVVFNYAKEQLGIIATNPATGVQIPQVRVQEKKPRGLSKTELTKMWTALKQVSESANKRPERYWIPILGLYHGFRLNEICSLHLKDVYRDDDGVYVININADGVNKKVKNKSSVRIIPVHPFVLTDLKFKKFVEERKANASKNDLLFPNLTHSAHGYGKKMTVWFSKWKKTWLPTKSHHKHFHDLRYTFSQQAQNQAKIPDRYSQEITGHSIAGTSSVHLGYSGRLKPKAVLEELRKLQYGWEK